MRQGSHSGSTRRRLIGVLAGCALAAALAAPAGAAAATDRATLTWDTTSDLDLHVWDDAGNHAYWADETGIPNATLSPDVTNTGGPETFTDDNSPSMRTFVFGVCDFSEANGGGGGTNYTLQVTDPGGGTRTLNGHLNTSQTGEFVAVSPNGAVPLPSGNPCNRSSIDDPPTCTAANELVAQGGSAHTTIACSDPDGDPLTFTQYPGFPNHGTWTEDSTQPDPTALSGTYKETDSGFSGDDHVYYVVNDGRGNSVFGVLNVQVRPNTSTPPNAGDWANGKAVSGDVTVKLPGDPTFYDLDAGVRIPIGSQVDTTNGEVKLTTDTAGSGRAQASTVTTQTAYFRAGLFKLTQPQHSALVTEILRGAIDCTVPRASSSSATAEISRRRRRLWGRGHGRHRTRGRHGSASVRGTEWLTEDRCDGTFFKVKHGTVLVYDKHKHKTVTVTAGHTYLAKAP